MGGTTDGTTGTSSGAQRAPEVNSERASPAYYKEALALTLKRLGWRNVTSGRPSVGCVVWCDEPTKRPDFLALPVAARINRFYAMVRVCRKVCLAQLLDVCTRLHPEHFGSFTPTTWWVGKSWPSQLKRHRAFCEREGASDTPFIVKPDNGCQGAGIALVRGHAELAQYLRSADAPERAVVQEYLSRPLLLDGLKFDLRLYVILTCAAPLQAFLSVHGVARFATHAWAPVDASNQADLLMHLSNSSINQVASGVTNKRSLTQLWAQLAAAGHDAAAVWASVQRVVALTLAAMQPLVAHNYTTSFAQPWLLEVNHSPSMALGGAEAGEIEAKTSVLRAALRLGLAAEHPPELCEACEVVPLQAQAAQLGAHGPRKRPRPLVSRLWPPRAVWQSAAAPLQAAPFCSLEAARRLFELSATSRAQQLWTLDCTGFERIFADAKVGDAERLRAVFAAACNASADPGTGWDAPAKGQMTWFGFVEALLELARSLAEAEEPPSGVEPGGTSPGLAAALDALLERTV